MARYAYDQDYEYNCFGADEHLVVTLYRLNRKGTTWKPVRSWCYSTFLSSSLADSRALARTRRLEREYHAEPL
jgi:hypothetical protein